MQPKAIWANLASSDLKRTTLFYKKLGFRQNGEPTSEITSFLFGEGNFVIHFITQERLVRASNFKAAHLKEEGEILFSLSASSKEEVDEWVVKVQQAGGTLFSEPQKFEKGYTFGFADPDGHKFNVLYWPGM